MKNQELGSKCLDTAIKTMERNRALLFAINLLAALLLVIVYLENSSFDRAQRSAHLIRYQQRCNEVTKSVNEKSPLNPDEVKIFEGCSDLEKMRGILIVKIKDSADLSNLSTKMLGLHIIQNEMKNIRLDTASLTPLGFGLAVPRNDLVVICGVLLAVLYTWLAFSFKQHALIITKIRTLFPDTKNKTQNPPNPDETQFHLNDLIEMNFLFRTSSGGKTKWLVQILYWAAPISMTLAVLNNLQILLDTSDYIVSLRSALIIQLAAQLLLTIFLWIIGYDLFKSDKKANIP